MTNTTKVPTGREIADAKMQELMENSADKPAPWEEKELSNEDVDAAFEGDAEPTTQTVAVAPSRPQALAVASGLSVQGLEDIPTSDLVLPIVKLVQGTTSKVDLANGGTANPGDFYNTADRVATEDITFSILRAKKIEVQYDDNEPQANYALLGVIDGQLSETGVFMMRIPLTSMSAMKKIFTEINRKREDFPQVWAHKIKATSITRDRKNGSGSYRAMEMSIVGQNGEDVIEALTFMYETYATSLDRGESNPEDERL